jgi:hypothetical protein
MRETPGSLGRVEVWSAAGAIKLERNVALELAKSPVRVDPISVTEMALTAVDGSQIAIINLSTGETRAIALSSAEISQAQAQMQEIKSNRTPAPSGASVAAQAIIAVTGGDGTSGLLYGLVYPVKIGAPVPAITIDTAGRAASWGSCQLTSNLPIKLVKAGAEVGILYSDGTISWYTA